ncbi:hypothetical protein Tco_1329155 [Tanacetum coccineum]
METQKPLLKDADVEDYVLVVQDSSQSKQFTFHAVKIDLRYLTSDYAASKRKVSGSKSTARIMDIYFMQTKIHIDNESTIFIVKNPIFHSKTKHIKIKHHFIRDSNEKKLIKMIKIHTDQNVADLLIKAFHVSRFEYLIASIVMLNL